MRTALIAVQFLTRVPVRLEVAPTDTEMSRAAGWFPIVGAMVGGAAALAWSLAGYVRLPGLAPWFALAAAVVLTGAMHEDGLADTCDGLFGGATRQRRLEIMRDSRIGSFGALALVIVLGVQVNVLGSLGRGLGWRSILVAHVVSRAAALGLTRLPYARAGDGMGRPLAQALPLGTWVVAAIIAGASLFLVPFTVAVAFVGAATAIVVLAGWRFSRDLGGITGDALGAVTKLVEVGCYIAAAAISASTS